MMREIYSSNKIHEFDKTILNYFPLFSISEGYMFEEHTMIRRAAIQCWTNLCTSPLMAKRCEAPNDLGKSISRNFSF